MWLRTPSIPESAENAAWRNFLGEGRAVDERSKLSGRPPGMLPGRARGEVPLPVAQTELLRRRSERNGMTMARVLW